MEDALALRKVGRREQFATVLILVLMEDALALFFCCNPYRLYHVLILVLMEDALARESGGPE